MCYELAHRKSRAHGRTSCDVVRNTRRAADRGPVPPAASLRINSWLRQETAGAPGVFAHRCRGTVHAATSGKPRDRCRATAMLRVAGKRKQSA
jgi:hypothetical protein